ncbi:MAG: hypothetical protein EPN99_14195 [Frankiales bacterium]|nr:MAG: hypothetical protein EPN99_14195 [Frankiales bacterium]
MLIPRTLVVGALGALALGTVATGANAGHSYDSYDRGDDLRAVSYINGDGGKNADVDPNSSCYNPDQYDMQAFSSAASGNPGDNNVHNDACFLDDDGNKVGDGIGASFVSSGTGYISACPDPDGAGPQFARLRDLNGDGRNDSCFQSSYQKKNAAGDFEYHVRVNNTGNKGEQQVTWGRDDDRDGRIDNRDDDDIKIDWSADGKDGGDRSYSW